MTKVFELEAVRLAMQADAQRTTLKAIVGPVFNVLGYGATGLDAAADTKAFHDAVAAYKAAGQGTVYFPAGVWHLQDAVADAEGIVIAGAGGLATTIKVVNTTGYGLTIGNATTRRFHMTLQDLTFIHATTPTAGAQVRLLNIGQSTIERVKFMSWNIGYTAVLFKDCSQVRFLYFRVQGSVSDAVIIDGGGDVMMQYGTIEGCGGHGIRIKGTQGIAMDRVGGYQNVGSFCYFDETGPATTWCSFAHSGGDTGGTHNWQIRNCEGIQFTDCWAGSHMVSAPDASHGFFIEGTAKDLGFVNSRAMNNNGHGWFVAGARDVRFVGCSARRNGVKMVDSAAVRAHDVFRLTATGNDFYEDYITPTQDYGIWLSGTTNKYLVTNNNLTDNMVAPLRNEASGATRKVANNLGYNPRGAITPPAIPASGAAYTPSLDSSLRVFVSGGTVSSIAINGATTGATSGQFLLEPGETITLGYTVAPTWSWFGL